MFRGVIGNSTLFALTLTEVADSFQVIQHQSSSYPNQFILHLISYQLDTNQTPLFLPYIFHFLFSALQAVGQGVLFRFLGLDILGGALNSF